MVIIVQAYGESQNLPLMPVFANTIPRLWQQPSTEIEMDELSV